MQLSTFITRFIFTIAFISTLFAFFISTAYQYVNFQQDKTYIKEEFTSLKRKEIQREVLSVYNLIEHKELMLEKALNDRIKERVYQAYNIAYSIYNQNKDEKSSDEIKYLIAAELKNLKYENDKTYFFINSNKGQAVLFNKNIELNNYKNVWNMQDENGEFIIQNQAKIALEKKEGFLMNSFIKPDSTDSKLYSKLSFVKLFEPYDWHIGMGEYIDEIREANQKEILNWISSVRFGKEGYLFVNTFDKKALVFDGKKLETPIIYPNENIFKMQLEQVKNSEGGFFSYKFKKLNQNQEFDKIAFVKSYDKYNWIIGSGVYLDEMESELKRKEAIFKETIEKQFILILAIFTLILFVIYLISKHLSKYINSNLENLTSSFETACRENKKITTEDLTYKEFISLANNLNSTLEEKNRTERKLNSYIEIVNKNVLISSTNKEGIITDISEAFCEISGYSKKELIGKTHAILKHDDTSMDFFTNMWDIILSGKEWRGEIKNKTKQGNTYWVYSIIKPRFKNGSINGFTSISTNITDKKHVEYLSITDELTGLYNRRFFNLKIEEEINRAKREKNYFSFLIMDIDYFKQYNDTYGHQKGDLALEKVAEILKKKTSRGSDFAFRLGGEEFGIITTLDKEKMIEFANIIKNEIENLQIEHSQSKVSKFLTTSIGLISKKEAEITNSDNLYKEADDCLYEAKKLGRNSIFIL
jgi:diguanylate cyclase (GGDEF)-like protein/PAS domain S-box-containing protein